jgi:sugar lactone lactonase YvrE
MTRRAMLAAIAGLAGVGFAALILVPRFAPAFAPGGTPVDAIGGVQPSYGPAAVAAVPNAKAILHRFWVPGLDAGYDPQGLAVIDGAVLVSGYRSNGFQVHRGPCRVVRLDPASGRETGQVDVPAPCGHAGGVADAGDGMLYLADTHTLFAVPLAQAFTGPEPEFRRMPLGDGLVGALAASAPGAIWLGTYREDGPGRLYRFDREVLSRLHDGESLTVAQASAQLAIPSYAQGAAFDRDGGLWLARSDTRWGEIDRLDRASGMVQRRYAAAAEIEGIAFDRAGLMWAVSEAGARHDYGNFFARLVIPFFPLVFASDPERLE